ncbi:phosphatidylinositol N-acetylglucosaminyltransferase subunit H-like isoform X2 [Anneissia japonica]|uniref:phosphatidylinositol N-acetylglucosaminyltransferase subunit H-like isoform X2 n=1 Tax=Anneissia japonica TaxID=1529436 RepID=UPI0014257721|nr:phosphatidylinositol N-acetylglucosaminyltransferase subunit H-like isoform X2 [Anneissia japonica]
MYVNVLNAHGQEIHVHPEHTFRRGSARPDAIFLQRNEYGSDWAGCCAPLKFVTISQSIFSLWFFFTAVVCVACVAYFAVATKNSVFLNYVVAVLLSACILYILYILFCKVKDETIVLLPSIGIQLQKCSAFGQHSTEFIPYDIVKDVVINEAISMYKVIYYLVVLVNSPTSDSEESVIPVFTNSLPRLDILRVIYNICQEALHSHQQERLDLSRVSIKLNS